MTPEQILALIHSHKEEYSADRDQCQLLADASDKIVDREHWELQANLATAKVVALGRILYCVEHLERASLDEAVAHLLNVEQIVIRQRDREGQEGNNGK